MPLITPSKLSELTGIDRRSVVRRLSGLAPVETKGRERHYDSIRALGRLYRQDGEQLDPGQEKARLDKERRLEVEERRARVAGHWVLKADVAKDLADACSVILSAWDAFPPRLAPLLAATPADLPRVEALLIDAVERAQEQVSAALEAAARGT